MDNLNNTAESYLDTLCNVIPNRAVGSTGNRMATDFFQQELKKRGWNIASQEFSAMDWKTDCALLKVDDQEFEVFSSTYSLGCNINAPLVCASNKEELESINATDKILLLHGEITAEQLMPKNFVFYNPERHQKIISLLESSGVKAIITATGRNSALAGGAYPFPLIEDGDFDVPSVFMTEEEGIRLLNYIGKKVSLESKAERFPANGCNMIGTKGKGPKKIVITAHIDAKKGTPGAIDNATGILVLLLLADLHRDYKGSTQIELTALNGEDYYAVPGQMEYIRQNEDNFDDILLNINIDGAGYIGSEIAFSFFDVPDRYKRPLLNIMNNYSDIKDGALWPQGDHSIFVQYGRPALAVTSLWFIENMETQDVTHTSKDNPTIVDCNKIVTISKAITDFINMIG